MEQLSEWLNDVLLVEAADWLRSVLDAAVAAQWIALSILCLALLVGLTSRSILIFLAALVLASFSVWLIAGAPTPVLRNALPGLGGLALLFLTIGLYRFRSTIARQAAKLRELSARNKELQSLLDREIRWRMAAEPPGQNAPAKQEGANESR